MSESKTKTIASTIVLGYHNKTCKVVTNRVSLSIETFPTELHNVKSNKCKLTLMFWESLPTSAICSIAGESKNHVYAGNSVPGVFILNQKMKRQIVELEKTFDHNSVLEFWDLEGKPLEIRSRWQFAIRVEYAVDP